MEIKKQRGKTEEKSVTEDLVTDIISRLLAKDLTRFTCVSKSWRSLISTDPYFHRLHVQHTASIDRHVLLIGKKSEEAGLFLYHNYRIDLDTIESPSIHIREINDPFDVGHTQGVKVLGSCHGLLLLQHRPSLKMVVSNPTTEKHVRVPSKPAGNATVVFYGLGYDHVHDCYKVVAKVKHLLELMVYDLNKGAWRSVQLGAWWRSQYDELKAIDERLGSNHRWDDDCSVEFVDGAVYWCIDVDADGHVPREMMTMVCFLLAEEEFHVVKPPDLGEVKYWPNMTVLDERLGLACEGLDNRYEIWRMDMDYDDDGKRQWRWTKSLVISDPYAMLPSCFNRLWGVLHPVYFSASKSNMLFLVGHRQLFLYDLRKKEFRKHNNRINDLTSKGNCYARSFVSRMEDLGCFERHDSQ